MSDPFLGLALNPWCVECHALPGNPHRPGCRKAEGQVHFDARLNQHEISESCKADHCEWHHVDEPGPAYIVCGECFHSYSSARALRSAYRRQAFRIHWKALWGGDRFKITDRAFAELAGIKLPRFMWLRTVRSLLRLPFVRASKIYFCPECSHDF
jgi:hypothetical protein